jgi:hypothetical protein
MMTARGIDLRAGEQKHKQYEQQICLMAIAGDRVTSSDFGVLGGCSVYPIC